MNISNKNFNNLIHLKIEDIIDCITIKIFLKNNNFLLKLKLERDFNWINNDIMYVNHIIIEGEDNQFGNNIECMFENSAKKYCSSKDMYEIINKNYTNICDIYLDFFKLININLNEFVNLKKLSLIRTDIKILELFKDLKSIKILSLKDKIYCRCCSDFLYISDNFDILKNFLKNIQILILNTVNLDFSEFPLVETNSLEKIIIKKTKLYSLFENEYEKINFFKIPEYFKNLNEIIFNMYYYYDSNLKNLIYKLNSEKIKITINEE